MSSSFLSRFRNERKINSLKSHYEKRSSDEGKKQNGVANADELKDVQEKHSKEIDALKVRFGVCGCLSLHAETPACGVFISIVERLQLWWRTRGYMFSSSLEQRTSLHQNAMEINVLLHFVQGKSVQDLINVFIIQLLVLLAKPITTINM